MDQHAWPDRRTPLQSVWSVALSVMMVECEDLFVYLIISTSQIWAVECLAPVATYYRKSGKFLCLKTL